MTSKTSLSNWENDFLPLNMNEIAKRLKIARKSLRKLEKSGLLKPSKTSFQGPLRTWSRRQYLREDFRRITFAVRLMKFGWKLDEAIIILKKAGLDFKKHDPDDQFWDFCRKEFRKVRS